MPLFGQNIKKMKDKGDVRGLIKSLESDKPEIHSAAAEALIDLKDIQGLAAVLKEGNYKERSKAVGALRDVGSFEGLIEALKDDSRIIRIEVVQGLRDIKSVKGIAKALKDKDAEVRGEAILALENIGSSEAVEAIQKKAFEVAGELGFEDTKKEDVETWGSIGGQLLDSGQHADALACFNQVIVVNPQDARGWGGKGYCLVGLNRIKEALSCAEKAKEIDPKNLGVRNLLSIIYYTQGQYEKMIPLNRETLELDPASVKARVALGEALACLTKLREAELELQKALEFLHQQEWMKPEDLAMVHQELALVSAMRGDKGAAFEHFQKARSAAPRDEWTSELMESYQILDIMAFAMGGDPLERRRRLLDLAEKRTKAMRGEGISREELTIAYLYKDSEEPISYWMERWSKESWLSPSVQGVMLKLWPSEYFAKAAQILSKGEFEAFRRGLEERMKE